VKIDPVWTIIVITTIVITFLAFWFVFVVRQIYAVFITTKEKRVALEAQRHMLRFCQNPTQRNWQTAWTFITKNQISLNDLEWHLVERFTKMGYITNFPPDAEPS
jgi:hypothetical protein